MKKATMNTIVNYINDNQIAELFSVRDELIAELNKGAEKAQANRDMYDSAKEVVLETLRDAGNAVTIAELYDACAEELPQGMSKSKLQYAVTRLWTAEIEKVEGKVNSYKVRG